MTALRSTIATVFHSQSSDADRFLPEGPRSVVVEGRPGIAWVNIQTATDSTRGDIHVRLWDGEHRAHVQPARPGFWFPTDCPNTLLVGMEKQVGTLNLTTNTYTALADIGDPNPRTIINDGEIVPGGRAIVFGTKDVRFAFPVAKLYLFTLDDRRLSVLAEGQLCSNGKCFAQDANGLVLYDIDTPHRNVVRYRLDLAGRAVSEKSEVLSFRDEPGFPDGMVDVGDGTVIVAYYNPEPVPAGRAVRYDLKTGKAVEEWLTPGSPRVTCPLLVEHEGRVRLVLTTATEGMPAEMRGSCPSAGDLFWAETNLERISSSEIVQLSS